MGRGWTLSPLLLVVGEGGDKAGWTRLGSDWMGGAGMRVDRVRRVAVMVRRLLHWCRRRWRLYRRREGKYYSVGSGRVRRRRRRRRRE